VISTEPGLYLHLCKGWSMYLKGTGGGLAQVALMGGRPTPLVSLSPASEKGGSGYACTTSMIRIDPGTSFMLYQSQSGSELGPRRSISFTLTLLRLVLVLHCKKRLAIFPSPARMSLNKLSPPGRVWLVTHPGGGWENRTNFFYSVIKGLSQTLDLKQ
jgi:hypothetical protein